MALAQGETLPTTVPAKHGDPAAGKSVWEDNAASSKVEDADKAVNSAALDPATYKGSQSLKTGLYALENTDLFNLLCIPPDTRDGDTDKSVYDEALTYCVSRRAFLLVDPPSGWKTRDQLIANPSNKLSNDLGLSGDKARNAAVFYPRVTEADPLRQNHLDAFVPCGIVAGLMARTDANRGGVESPGGH